MPRLKTIIFSVENKDQTDPKIAIVENDNHNPINNITDDYEQTAHEFIVVLKSAGTNPDYQNDDVNDEIETHFCQEYSDDGYRFPHIAEIGIHFGLNMLTLVSWLVVIIGLVLRVVCYLDVGLRVIESELSTYMSLQDPV